MNKIFIALSLAIVTSQIIFCSTPNKEDIDVSKTAEQIFAEQLFSHENIAQSKTLRNSALERLDKKGYNLNNLMLDFSWTHIEKQPSRYSPTTTEDIISAYLNHTIVAGAEEYHNKKQDN